MAQEDSATTSQRALLDAIKRLEDKMDERMSTMKRELTEERERADERLVKRMKLEKMPTFKKKSHEVQYRFNEEVRSKFEAAKTAISEAPPAVEKAKTSLEEGEKLITERQKLIKIADRSEHGWATVEEYEDDELAEDSDDEKRLVKAEARAGRKLKQKLAKGKVKKTFKKPSGWWQKLPYSNNAAANSSFAGSSIPVPGTRVSQTSVSQSGVSQLGPCFCCGGMGHFKKQCPVWLRAQTGTSSNQ